MPYKSPWHSAKETEKKVYHNNSACTEGNNIETYYLRAGSDNRPLCERCKKLNEEGR